MVSIAETKSDNKPELVLNIPTRTTWTTLAAAEELNVPFSTLKNWIDITGIEIPRGKNGARIVNQDIMDKFRIIKEMRAQKLDFLAIAQAIKSTSENVKPLPKWKLAIKNCHVVSEYMLEQLDRLKRF